MSQKLLTVVGGTGTQGLSVINSALSDGTYRVRALTRNPESPKAQTLSSRGVEVVQADLNSPSSLLAAFSGSSAIYAVTDFFEPFGAHGPEKAIEIESAQGINLAKAAASTPTLEHYIWSTLPNAGKLTSGKHLIPHFVAKNRVDAYIQSESALLAKTTFFWITWYANNYQYPMFTPIFVKSANAYIQLSPASPNTPVKTIGSPHHNVGPFALATLLNPSTTLPGKTVRAAIANTSTGELLKDWEKATGKTATYVQTSLEAFSAVWPMWGMEMGSMMGMWDEFREHWGEGQEGVVGAEELGVDVKGMVGVREGYREMDWEKLL